MLITVRDDTPGLFDLTGSAQTHGRFDAARLTQARCRKGWTKAQLAKEIGVTSAAIGQYEAGVNAPRVNIIKQLANALGVRPDFFSVGRPHARLDTVNAHFRSLRSAKLSSRHKALAMATLVWELTFALERHVKLPDADLPQIEPGTSPTEAAGALRRHWSLPDGPVRHLVTTAESHGIIVSVRPFEEVGDVDAFSVVIVGRPLVITTPRRTENVFRHRFSVAHELGHLLLHGDVEETSTAIEKEADEFAAAFLTPAAEMDEALPQRLDLTELDRLGRIWGVSSHSLVRRMVERGRTTESSARRAYQRLAMITDPLADPSSAYPGEVPTLLKAAVDLAGEHGAGVPVLAEELKVPPAFVRDLLGEPDSRPVLRLV